MVCARCGRQFLISPKQAPFLSDRRVERAAARLGAGGTRWYTVNQVVADLAARRRLRLGWLRWTRDARMDAARRTVGQYAAAGRLPQCIVREEMERPPQAWSEPDLFDYGAERILVVDDPLVVDLLVRNGVHLEAKAIVLSVEGYPRQVTTAARALVAERHDVPISILHATDRPRDEMVGGTRRLLGASDWMLVTDLGLAPGAAKRLKVLRWARRLSSVAVDHLPTRYLTAGLIGAMIGGPALEAAQAADDGGDGMLLALWASDDDFG